ncbi:unnamed protein product, partial [Heterosigma akashiwo]
YPRERNGESPYTPLQSFWLFKKEKSGNHKARLVKPGKLTPYINRSSDKNPEETEYPYRHKHNQQVRLDNGKYRHIASFTLEELRKMQWDGAMYQSKSYPGLWVPYVSGYDSDPAHVYEDFDVTAAKREGTVGSSGAVGKYMIVARTGLIQLK